MNLLPLDSWRTELGIHPFYFWQLSSPALLPQNGGNLVYQSAWMNDDAVGRQEIIDAIGTAEERLRNYLGYGPAPRYVEYTQAWPTFRDPSLLRTGPVDAAGRWLSVALPEGEIRAVGTEALTVISAAAAVTYSDVDGDAINDTWTASAATSVTDTSQIAVYFAVADRFGDTTVSARWRILPVNVAISGGTVTVSGGPGGQGGAWLLVKPIKYQGVTATTLDPTVATNFVTTVAIYQRTTETNGTTVATSQGVIEWETQPCHSNWWCCCGCNTPPATAYGGAPYDPAAVAQAVARVGVRDRRTGAVTPAEAAYDTTTATWASLDWTVCAQPDRVLVRVLAGLPLDSDGQMQAPWRTIVARLTAAELDRPISANETANRSLYRWQFDLARSSGNADEAYGAVSQSDLDNPFGTRRGHVYAWRQVRNLRQLHGALP